MVAAAAITRLSVEIFAEILSAADSSQDLVNLACTCKTVAHLTGDALSRHRNAYRSFRFASDRDPATITALVRSLVLRRDPLVAKYFRSFDVWGARLSWDEWRWIDVDETGVKLASEEHAVDRFSAEEIEQLLDIASDVVGVSDLSSAREELENGGDGLLKTLIIASAPHLEKLKFIRREDLLHKSCQAWLHKAIKHQLDTRASKRTARLEYQWPPGLESIQDLGVGVDAGVADEHVEPIDSELRADWEGYPEISAIMRLPCLTSLYYHTVCFPEEDEDDWESEPDEDIEEPTGFESTSSALPFSMPKMSSAVTHIYLDGVRGDYTDVSAFYHKLLAMPRALESFAVRWSDGEYSPGNFLGALGCFQKQSLQKIMFYNPSSMVGYRCSAYRPEDVPDGPLAMWWQCVEDIELQALYDRSEGQATHEDIVSCFERYVARREAEVIILDGNLSGNHMEDDVPLDSCYEDALLALLRALGPGNLKALFIDFPNNPDSDGDLHSPDGFAKVVRLAEELGVDLYGSKHLRTSKRHVLDFPMAIHKWEIPTGPYYGKRVEQGFTGWDCVGDKWCKPEADKYGWHYTRPEEQA